MSGSAVLLASSYAGSSKNSDHIIFAAGGSGVNGGIHLYKASIDGTIIAEIAHVGKGEDHGFQCYHNGILYSECSIGPKKKPTCFVKAYRFNHRRQELTEISSLPSEGKLCHMETQGTLLVGTAFRDAYIETFQLAKDGRIERSIEKCRFKSDSGVKSKRNKVHPHAFKFDPEGRFGFMPDVGRDLIQAFEVKGSKLKYRSDLDYKSKAGAGPRHFTFHPDGKSAYLINESDFTLTAFDYLNGQLTPTDTQSCLPMEFKKRNSGADVHVHPEGKLVYASNRGHDSLAVFSLEEEGKLKLLSNESTKGQRPRNFAIHQDFALVTNKLSDSVIFFSLDPETGKLKERGRTEGITRPSCVNVL